MSYNNGQIFSVITGDIIGSTSLDITIRRKLPDFLFEVSDKLQKYFECLPCPMGVYQGDRWQLLISDPGKSLRIAMFIRAYIRGSFMKKKVDTNFFIGVGEIDYLPENDILKANGEAFWLSGRALDEMSKTKCIAISFPTRYESDLTNSLNVILQLIDSHVINWTSKQSLAVSGALIGYTQQKIADIWFKKTITQQAIAQHLSRAEWKNLEKAIKFYEEIVPKVIM